MGLWQVYCVQNFVALITTTWIGKFDDLSKVVHRLHQNILKCGSIVGGQNGIGTTFSGIRFFDGKFIYGHVGYIMVYDHETVQ